MAFSNLAGNQMVSQVDLVSSFSGSSSSFTTNLKGTDLTTYINGATNRWVNREEAQRVVSLTSITGDQSRFVVKSEMVANSGYTYLLRSNVSIGTDGQCNIKVDDPGGSGVVIDSNRVVGIQNTQFRVTSVGDDINVIVTHSLGTFARVIVSSLDGTNATARTVPSGEASTFYGILKRDILVSIQPASPPPLVVPSDATLLATNIPFYGIFLNSGDTGWRRGYTMNISTNLTASNEYPSMTLSSDISNPPIADGSSGYIDKLPNSNSWKLATGLTCSNSGGSSQHSSEFYLNLKNILGSFTPTANYVMIFSNTYNITTPNAYVNFNRFQSIPISSTPNGTGDSSSPSIAINTNFKFWDPKQFLNCTITWYLRFTSSTVYDVYYKVVTS